ncbi:hypothetical protein P4O66_017333 [Electrophorus voltai]|nr:hypothetical protein P4O66_017333 [Electrophorus voltai]
MSVFGKLFGNAGKGGKSPSPQEAIQKLRETEEMLTKKQEYLEQKIQAELVTAKKNGTKNKRAALQALKRKKRYEKQLAQIDGTLSTIEFQREALENANTNTEVLKNMGFAAKAMKNAHQNMDIDKVDELMQDITEQQELAQEISDAISKPVGFGEEFDEDELLAELEELEQEELDNNLLEIGGPETVPLPNVPSVPVPAKPVKKREEEDEDEMAELKAWILFDPSTTKKKKKKKKPFMLEEEGDGLGEESQQAEPREAEPEAGEEREVELEEDDSRKKEATDDLDDLNFFNQKKKKKKPKKVFENDLEEGMKELKIEAEQHEVVEDDDLDLMLPAKKKKAKKVEFVEEGETLEKDDALEDDEGKNLDGITFSSQTGPAWAGSERDYTYDELLSRVFNIMREKNPDMVAGEKRKFVMKPPQVVRVGTKKTSFVNFTDICKLLHRQPKHLLAFLLAELGTSGSIDGNNQLVIKGRFQQKQIENVLRRYIKEYVTCHTCRSPDTILQKDTRLYFLQCETCHSRCSVASIKTGFQAVTGKRAQLRAKAN